MVHLGIFVNVLWDLWDGSVTQIHGTFSVFRCGWVAWLKYTTVHAKWAFSKYEQIVDSSVDITRSDDVMHQFFSHPARYNKCYTRRKSYTLSTHHCVWVAMSLMWQLRLLRLCPAKNSGFWKVGIHWSYPEASSGLWSSIMNSPIQVLCSLSGWILRCRETAIIITFSLAILDFTRT